MTGVLRAYVRVIYAINYRIGRVMMYGIFVMMGILLWSAGTKVGSDLGLGMNPALWTLETAQFAMVAYYMVGGPYAIQMGSNVRMDLFYGTWSAHTKAWVDAFTVLFLIFYLGVLLWGGIASWAYSLGDFSGEPFAFFRDLIHAFLTGGPDAVGEVTGHLERSSSVWRPFIWPVKLIMVFGIFLMLLQAIAELIKDIFRIRGEDI